MRPKCKKEECENQAAYQQAYCSRSCAPYGNLGVANTSSANQTPRSIYAAHGGASAQPSLEGLLIEQKQERDRLRREQKKQKHEIESEDPSTTTITKSDSIASDAREPERIKMLKTVATETGIPEIEQLPLEESRRDGPVEIPSKDSKALSIDVHEARLTSMSLIDSSVIELKGLMSAAARSATRTEHINPQLVGSACNAAKQMYGLLRLKLDIIKEVRKDA